MKKRVESVCLPVYAQTSHTTITQAYPDAAPRGTSATCGRRTCCSHPPRGSPRVWKSGSRPHKNVQTILYAVPLSGEAGKGMAGDHQAFPPAMAHLEPQQSRGGGTSRFHHTQGLSLQEVIQRFSFHRRVEYVLCSYCSVLQPF